MAAFEWLAPLPRPVWAVYGAVTGLCIGSFLNVVAYRLPRGLSLRGRSVCPACGAEIRWYDNLPVVSYLLLRARCRACGGRIAWRYPAVEALGAAIWGVAAWRWGPTPGALATAAAASLLAVLALIDLDHLAVPDGPVLGLAVLGLGAAAAGWGPRPLDALLAAGGAAALFGLVVAVTRGGMGSGDVILAGAIGANLGVWHTALALWTAMILAGLVASLLLLLRLRGRKDPIPYGPFLAAGAILLLLGRPPA
jgi:leader peptidase (prepilin peptidase)/N-methyltransferase